LKVCARRYSFILASLLLVTLHGAAEEISLPLIWNIEGRSVEILSTIDPETNLLKKADGHALGIALSPLLAENSFLSGEPGESDIFIEELQEQGLEVDFNPSTLQINLTIPPELKKVQDLSLTRQSTVNRQEALPPEPFSAYTNLFGNHSLTQGSEGLHHFTSETAVNWQSWVLYNRSDWDSENRFAEPELTLFHDFTGPLIRMKTGHFRPDAGGFQQSGLFQGISLERYFAMSPDRAQPPSSGQIFFLQQESQVEVWVNHRLVQTLNLQAGRYNLQDFPFYSGINRIDLEITGKSGSRERLSFFQSYNRTLLDKGVMDFHISAGVSPWTGEEWILTANQDYGLLDTLNVNWNLQGNEEKQLAGLGFQWATDLGNIQLDGAAAIRDGSYKDWAIQGSYRLILHSSPKAPVPSFNLRYQGREFTPETGESPLQWDSAFSVQQRISSQMSLQGSVNYSRYWDEEASWQINGILQIPFHPRAGLSVRYNSRINDSIENNLSILLQVRSAKGNSSLNYRQDLSESVNQVDFQQRFPEKRASMSASMTGKEQLQAQLNWQGNRLETSGSFQVTDPYNAFRPGASLRYGTALAFAGGTFALSRPIHDSFAIVLPRYSLEGRAVGINPQPNYEAKSDFLGPAVLSNIPSYQYRTLHTELLDYREDDLLRAGSGDFTLFPLWRSGTLVYLGQPERIQLSCRMVDEENQPILWQAGKIIGVETEQWFFTDQTGLALIYDLLPGSYEIHIPGFMPYNLDLSDENTGQSLEIRLKGDSL